MECCNTEVLVYLMPFPYLIPPILQHIFSLRNVKLQAPDSLDSIGILFPPELGISLLPLPCIFY